MHSGGEQRRRRQAGQEHRVGVRERERLGIEDVRVEEAARIPRSCWNTHPARHIENSGSPRSGTESMCRSCGKQQDRTDEAQARGRAALRPPRIAATTSSAPASVQTVDAAAPVGARAREERSARRDSETQQPEDQREEAGRHALRADKRMPASDAVGIRR